MGREDPISIIENVFIRDWSLGQFLFLSNNIELMFNFKRRNFK